VQKFAGKNVNMSLSKVRFFITSLFTKLIAAQRYGKETVPSFTKNGPKDTEKRGRNEFTT
jgi:hypothetical protein